MLCRTKSFKGLLSSTNIFLWLKIWSAVVSGKIFGISTFHIPRTWNGWKTCDVCSSTKFYFFGQLHEILFHESSYFCQVQSVTKAWIMRLAASSECELSWAGFLEHLAINTVPSKKNWTCSTPFLYWLLTILYQW